MNSTKSAPKLFRKKDVFLVCTLFAVAVLLGSFFFLKETGEFATVRIDGVFVKEIPLALNEQYTFENNGHTVVLQVKDHAIGVISSTCPEGICKETDFITHRGSTIVCLPANLSVTVDGSFSADGITY